ncbi:Hypothetical predicted protein, partial [Olea europaea subsp. europaea]
MGTDKNCPSQSDVPNIFEEKTKKLKVKKMLPLTVYCEHCGFCMKKGDRFDTVKEEVGWESLLKVPIWRFQFKCYSWSAPFSVEFYPG